MYVWHAHACSSKLNSDTVSCLTKLSKDPSTIKRENLCDHRRFGENIKIPLLFFYTWYEKYPSLAYNRSTSLVVCISKQGIYLCTHGLCILMLISEWFLEDTLYLKEIQVRTKNNDFFKMLYYAWNKMKLINKSTMIFMHIK